MEPRIFIGCSLENLEPAEFIQTQLQHVATVQIWNQGIFQSGDYTLEKLLETVSKFDFGIFLVFADDVATIRKKRVLIARDNVLFEAGIFFSHLGKKRTVLIVPNKSKTDKLDIHLPSDLNGLTLIKYYQPSRPEDLPAKLGGVCGEIKTLIKEQGTVLNEKIDNLINKLSGGLIYILRHINKRSINLDEVLEILIEFNSIKFAENTFGKTAKYAMQNLSSLNLVAVNAGNEFSITDLGSQFLKSGKVQLRFPREMAKPLFK